MKAVAKMNEFLEALRSTPATARSADDWARIWGLKAEAMDAVAEEARANGDQETSREAGRSAERARRMQRRHLRLASV